MEITYKQTKNFTPINYNVYSYLLIGNLVIILISLFMLCIIQQESFLHGMEKFIN